MDPGPPLQAQSSRATRSGDPGSIQLERGPPRVNEGHSVRVAPLEPAPCGRVENALAFSGRGPGASCAGLASVGGDNHRRHRTPLPKTAKAVLTLPQGEGSSGARSVCPLPPLWGRVGEGAS
jgi:hypothetical protein